MSRRGRSILFGAVAIIAAVCLILLFSGENKDFSAKYAGVDLSTDVTGIGRENTYDDYLARYRDLPAVSEAVQVDLNAMTGDGQLVEEGVYTADNSEVTWTVQVPQEGLYHILMDYQTVKSRGVGTVRHIQRTVNRSVPFPVILTRALKAARVF